MFEKASRDKIRFQTTQGPISVEDLWDLPLTSTRTANLNDIAVGLDRTIRQSSVSFVEPVAANTELQLKLDIVVHIIKVKKEERDAAKSASDKSAQKQKLLGILAKKQDAELEGKTPQQLEEMINSL